MRENAHERTIRYVEKTSATLRSLRRREPARPITDATITYVLDLAQRYVDDSMHYVEKRKPVTSLACVAYAEGILDAMKFLGLIDF